MKTIKFTELFLSIVDFFPKYIYLGKKTGKEKNNSLNLQKYYEIYLENAYELGIFNDLENCMAWGIMAAMSRKARNKKYENKQVFCTYDIDLNQLHKKFQKSIGDDRKDECYIDDYTNQFAQQWCQNKGLKKFEISNLHFDENIKKKYPEYLNKQRIYNFAHIRETFDRKHISIFNAPLGEKNLYKLDEVTENDFNKFNNLLNLLFTKYELFSIENNNCQLIQDITTLTVTFDEHGKKSSNDFIKIMIPELNIFLTEEWDYVYTLLCEDATKIQFLLNFIKESKLFIWEN